MAESESNQDDKSVPAASAEPESAAEVEAAPASTPDVNAQEPAPDVVSAPKPDPEPESTPQPEPKPTPTSPPAAEAPIAPPKAARRKPGRLRRIAGIALLVVLFGPPLQVLAYRFLPPPITELMAQRLIEGYGMDYQWRPLSQISPSLSQAAIASEDARFCSHHGFDFTAMQKALQHDERRPNKLKGGSTISQQTAKNVFLWPGRDYVRKAIEAWYTVLIETVWGKRRIMEVYLNVIEFGPGTYGAQAAAQRYFHEDASDLTPDQSAHLISVLPSPLKWRAVDPGTYVAKRTRRIDGAIGTVREDGLAGCLRS